MSVFYADGLYPDRELTIKWRGCSISYRIEDGPEQLSVPLLVKLRIAYPRLPFKSAFSVALAAAICL